MISLVLFFHLLICLALVGLVLLQQGKGASMGAAFGSGSSGGVFGSRGPAGFLMKLTSFLITLFFVTSLTLGYLASSQAKARHNLSLPSKSSHQQQAPASTKPQPATSGGS